MANSNQKRQDFLVPPKNVPLLWQLQCLQQHAELRERIDRFFAGGNEGMQSHDKQVDWEDIAAAGGSIECEDR